MTKARTESLIRLDRLGIRSSDALSLLRASALLHTWHEHECNGAIQRDENTGKPYWHNTNTGKRLYGTPDRETGAIKRVNAIAAKYGLLAYIQTDPRGCALYLYSAESLESYRTRCNSAGAEIDSCYSLIACPVYS